MATRNGRSAEPILLANLKPVYCVEETARFLWRVGIHATRRRWVGRLHVFFLKTCYIHCDAAACKLGKAVSKD